MSYINQIVEDGVTYDIAAKNLVNGFTQTTPGVNALDAAAGKSLNDSLSNLSTDVSTNYATKTELSNSFPVPISKGGTGETKAWEAAKALGLETHSMTPNGVDTLKIVDNIALIGGRRGPNLFLCLVTYWDDDPRYIYTLGAYPTITKTANSDTFTITNDTGKGAYPIFFITGTGDQHT